MQTARTHFLCSYSPALQQCFTFGFEAILPVCLSTPLLLHITPDRAYTEEKIFSFAGQIFVDEL